MKPLEQMSDNLSVLMGGNKCGHFTFEHTVLKERHHCRARVPNDKNGVGILQRLLGLNNAHIFPTRCCTGKS